MTKLPYNIDLNNLELLKLLNETNYSLGVLNGLLTSVPNPDIILSIITLSESKDSSAIENIITTYDELFNEMIKNSKEKKSSKEVLNYKKAIYKGYEFINKNGFINTNTIIDIHSEILNMNTGVRKLPGTVIRNDVTGEVIHTPPQSYHEIIDYLKNLEIYINDNNQYDPLINMAIIHYQFESIHPFYDGNGRTGRILNILYLVLKNKIDKPIIYLSKYINKNRNEYYSLLKKCNKDIKYIEEFVVFMLKGIKETSKLTINLIRQITELINITTNNMREKLPKIYSYEMVLHLFSSLYTKNEVFRNDLNISRNTATKYLKQLEEEGFLISEQVGKEVIYKNVQLFNILSENE